VRGRLAVVLVLLGLWVAAIGYRLGDLQVSRHDDYRARAERQHRLVIELEPPRGAIYDARGRVLAVSVQVDSAFADPDEVRQAGDVEDTARLLAAAAGADPEVVARRLAEKRDFVWLARQLDPPQAAAVKALDLPGVGFVKEYKRYYPMGALAAQVIGYAGIDQRGLAGLEHLFDGAVAGREGRQTLLRDARRGTAASPLLAGDEPHPGAALHLTLDAALQRLAERELARAVEEEAAKRGSVVILDPHDGAVLAMASYPPLDANRFPDFPVERRRNLPVMDAYEPGSTFKMVTAAAALSANLMDPTDEVECEMGAIHLLGVRIRDHKPFGRLTFRDVIARSSNIGAIKVGLAVGDRRLHDMAADFGFGRPTGIDLPAENPGELRPLDAWRQAPLTKAYVSFGQGVSVTPLQLARAFAAVANGGELLRPFVVGAVENETTGALERTPRRVDGRPLSAATARELERMLEAVVEDGTGKAAAVPGYAVAGKTGTAQKAVGGGYSDRYFVANFMGFVPARRPQLVIAVMIDEPWPRYHGGEVAAPVFARIAEPALLYLGVPPDGSLADPEMGLLAARLGGDPVAPAPAPAANPGPPA
jgi:cell division protein FtsI (penicillin-binding protein 3)